MWHHSTIQSLYPLQRGAREARDLGPGPLPYWPASGEDMELKVFQHWGVEGGTAPHWHAIWCEEGDKPLITEDCGGGWPTEAQAQEDALAVRRALGEYLGLTDGAGATTDTRSTTPQLPAQAVKHGWGHDEPERPTALVRILTCGELSALVQVGPTYG